MLTEGHLLHCDRVYSTQVAFIDLTYYIKAIVCFDGVILSFTKGLPNYYAYNILFTGSSILHL
jgi:hypothetical protein